MGQPFRICCFSPWKMRLGRRQCYRRRPSTLTCRCGIPILLSYGLGVIEWQIHLKYPWRSSMIFDISMFNPLSKGIGIVMFKHVSCQLLIPTHWIPSSPFCPSNKNGNQSQNSPIVLSVIMCWIYTFHSDLLKWSLWSMFHPSKLSFKTPQKKQDPKQLIPSHPPLTHSIIAIPGSRTRPHPPRWPRWRNALWPCRRTWSKRTTSWRRLARPASTGPRRWRRRSGNTRPCWNSTRTGHGMVWGGCWGMVFWFWWCFVMFFVWVLRDGGGDWWVVWCWCFCLIFLFSRGPRAMSGKFWLVRSCPGVIGGLRCCSRSIRMRSANYRKTATCYIGTCPLITGATRPWNWGRCDCGMMLILGIDIIVIFKHGKNIMGIWGYNLYIYIEIKWDLPSGNLTVCHGRSWCLMVA